MRTHKSSLSWQSVLCWLSLLIVVVFLCSCTASPTSSPSATARPGRTVSVTSTVKSMQPSSVVRATCQTSQLSLIVGRSGAALGHTSTPFTFINHSQQTCTLAGYPALQQQDARHKSVTEPILQNPTAYTYHTPGPRLITLAPGGKAYFVIEWTTICNSSRVFFLLITPPGNKTPFLVDLQHGTASPQTFSSSGMLPENQASLFSVLLASPCPDTVNISPLVASENLLYQQ